MNSNLINNINISSISGLSFLRRIIISKNKLVKRKIKNIAIVNKIKNIDKFVNLSLRWSKVFRKKIYY